MILSIGYMDFMMNVNDVTILSCGKLLLIVLTACQLVMLLFYCYHDNCYHDSCNGGGNYPVHAWRPVT